MSELRSALDGLSTVELQGMPAAVLGERITDLLEARNRLDGEIERAIGVFDAQGMGEMDGCPSTAAWLRGRGRLTATEATARVKTARTLRELPMIASALSEGAISFDHAKAVSLLAQQTDVADTRRVQRQVLDLARLTDPAGFINQLRAIRESLRRDKDDEPADETDAFSRRELSVHPVLDGFDVRGWLPDESGSLVKTVLDSLAKPLPGDTRTAAQRNADALIEVCKRTADAGELPTNHYVRPHLLVISQLDELLDAERAAMSQLGYGAQLSPTGTQRIACDAVMTRVLVNPEGQILDLGRTSRVVTPAQWKALVVRDGGCVVPFCDRPAQWCDAHHYRQHWTEGGSTDLDNLCLVCGYHHRLLHEGGWSLRLCGQRWIAVRPDGTQIEGRQIGFLPASGRIIADAILKGPRGPTLE